MGMDVIAWFYISTGKTDDLIVLANRFVLGDGMGGDLVPRRDHCIGVYRLTGHLATLRDVIPGHNDVVVAMKSDCGRLCLDH